MEQMENVMKRALASVRNRESIPELRCRNCDTELGEEKTLCPTCAKGSKALGKRYLGARKEQLQGDVLKAVDEFLEHRGGLYIHGPVGTGKTHVIAALAFSGLDSFKVNTAPKLLLELRESFNDKGASESQIIGNYTGCGVLALDDLGAEKTTEYALQSLYLIIDQRYRDMLPTVITSNFSLDELAKKLDDRIASRIAGMCQIIKLTGKDRRLK